MTGPKRSTTCRVNFVRFSFGVPCHEVFLSNRRTLLDNRQHISPLILDCITQCMPNNRPNTSSCRMLTSTILSNSSSSKLSFLCRDRLIGWTDCCCLLDDDDDDDCWRCWPAVIIDSSSRDLRIKLKGSNQFSTLKKYLTAIFSKNKKAFTSKTGTGRIHWCCRTSRELVKTWCQLPFKVALDTIAKYNS